MSKEIVKSLYLQSDFDVKFPSYLPEGFKPACNAENLPSYVIQIYVNQTAIDNYRKSSTTIPLMQNPYPPYLYAQMPEEQVKGIVQVHAQKYYSENPREQGYKTYRSFFSNPGGFVTNPRFFNEDGGDDNNTNSTSYLTYNEGRLLSVVIVLTDDAGYKVVGALPMEEMIKIAKSLSEGVKKS